MKRTWHHPEQPTTGKRYWRSPAELERRSEFLNTLGVEFPGGDTLNEEERENSRREFIKIMGAAAGLMGLASCRRPVVNIMPYANHAEWVIPGKPLLYASAMPRPYGVTPLVVTTHEGRPTHLSGNPLHPLGGGLDAFAQASVLDLYDPQRSQRPMAKGKGAGWGKANETLASISAGAKKAQGAGLAIVVGGTTSPTLHRLLGDIKKAMPQAALYGYEALSRDGAIAAGKAVLGAGVKQVVRLGKAERILALDCDFLGNDPVDGDPVKAFTKGRNPEENGGKMNRLYCLENRYTLTGGMADHRKAVAASMIPLVAAHIASELGEASAKTLASGCPDAIKAWLKEAIADLKQNAGKSVVIAGSRYGAEVHALVAAINNALGAFGSTVELVQTTGEQELGTLEDLRKEIAGGKVKTVVSLTGSNLLYDAPDAAGLSADLDKNKVQLVHLGTSVNATARGAALHLPAAHYLEAWSDARAADGTYSVIQPMIQPLYDGVSEIDLLLALLGRKKVGPAEAAAPAATPPGAAPAPAAPAAPVIDAGYAAVRDTFAAVAGGMDEDKWNFSLRDGFLKGSAGAAAGAPNLGAVAGIVGQAQAPAALDGATFEVVLATDSSMLDGRYASNAWLQEAPDPITKLTWDNAAWLASSTFRSLGLKEGQMIKVSVNGNDLVLPAIEAPGHAANSVTIPVGYGQARLGFVGSKRGFDAYPLRKAPGFILTGAKIEKLDEVFELAITQDHNTMEGRAMFREGTAEEFKKTPDFAVRHGMDAHIPENISLYKGQVGKKSDKNPEGFDYDTLHQWGMTIDLSKCIGCTACIVACQSENNIPVVGKDQVRKGRLMQWIRMDRYFAASEWGPDKAASDDVDIEPTAEQLDNAEMVHQPMACQQCESAPCETVCPVNATVHTEEGLNAMAYNRCIGTRYCANNCPYTARRFNWFDYNKRPLDELYWGPLSTPEKTGMRESLQLQKNPNVTVRMRGVIEKCTYCVQRLEAAKINQKRVQRDSKNFRVPTDSVKVACQQACPAEAIEFGDLGDAKSAVNAKKASKRNYSVLKYIGTLPRTSYLARVRNPNPAMPGADKVAAWSAHQS